MVLSVDLNLKLKNRATLFGLSQWPLIALIFVSSIPVYASDNVALMNDSEDSLYSHSLTFFNQQSSFGKVVSITDRHANFLSPNLFYDVKLNGVSSHSTESFHEISTSMIEPVFQNWQPLDAQVTLGYDLVKKSTNNYFGVGLSVAMRSPFMELGSRSTAVMAGETVLPNAVIESVSLFDDRTELKGFKVGPKILFGKRLGNTTLVYGQVGYALQRFQLKNSTQNFSSQWNGDYVSYELGMRYQPNRFSKKALPSNSLQSALYFTVGLNYAKSTIERIKLDVNGEQYPLKSEDFDLSNTTLNLGIGYQF